MKASMVYRHGEGLLFSPLRVKPPLTAGATACVHPAIRLSLCASSPPPLSLSFLFSLPHFPALTPPVSAVCLARRAERGRSRRGRRRSTSSTTRPPRRFSRPSRRRAAPCSSCPATRAKRLTSSMRSKSVQEHREVVFRTQKCKTLLSIVFL